MALHTPTQMNKLPLLLLPLSLLALADTPTALNGAPPAHRIANEPSANAPAPLFFDDREIALIPNEMLPQPAEPAASLADNATEDDSTLEAQINRAIIARDWATLPALLERYHAEPQHDPTLYDYALGALRRSQLRHDEATALYRGIVQRQPELAYPRFDLGVMLFEDKQYSEAKRELERAKPDLSPAMQAVAERYLAAIAQAQNWQPEMSLQYETTDNVNNAADAREIEINGRIWRKTEESLPQSAQGLRYGLGVERERNLGGHHFIYGRVHGDGVAYWDKHEYDEQSVNIALGYKNRTVKRALGIVPFFEQNWLGGSRYSHNAGVQVDFSHQLGKRWRVMLNAGYVAKRYDEPSTAQRYNGKMPLASATLMYYAPQNWLLYGGVDWSHDITQDAEQASVRKGVRLGTAKTFANGLGLRTHLRYARRTFDAAGTLVYLYPRQDDEYQANVSLWHDKLSWKSFTPHLNFRYLAIDSNMKGFYSRKNAQWFLSVERGF